MEEEKLSKLERKLDRISRDLEKAKIGEYVNLLNRPKRLLYINFVGGLARGLGTAIGITILGAVFFYVLKQTVNLPLIGKYIAELLQIIDGYR